MGQPLKILVIGDDTRSFLSVVRSLGRLGHCVDVIMHRPNPVSSKSRYIHQNHAVAPVALDPVRWLAAIEGLQSAHGYDVILPCDDSALLPFMRFPHSLDMNKILHPGMLAFESFYDKQKTLALCRLIGVPTALSQPVRGADLTNLPYPQMLKPDSSFTVESLAQKKTVIMLTSAPEAEEKIAAILGGDGYFLERYFEGVGVGVSVLAKAGEVTHAFQHERMEEGVAGGSSLRRAVPVHGGMLDAVTLLAREVQLNGVAMFEFRHNKVDDSFILLEVNARFWGSLPLAIYAGVDFPALLLAQHREQTVPVLAEYREGRVARALTASFYSFARSIAAAGDMKAKLCVVWTQVKGLGRMLVLREKVDSFAFDDPRPFVAEVFDILAMVIAGTSKRIGLAPLLWRLRAKRKQAWVKANRGRIRQILILCYGNICRSPFAEQLLRELLPSDHLYRVESAGFHMVENRASPEEAVAAGKLFGVDLLEHRSYFAGNEKIAQADLILLFDERNEIDLAAFYPAAVKKSINMGDFLKKPTNIEDPFGHTPAVYHACYSQIKVACERLVHVLEGKLSSQ